VIDQHTIDDDAWKGWAADTEGQADGMEILSAAIGCTAEQLAEYMRRLREENVRQEW
jgi:hypothetical protein